LAAGAFALILGIVNQEKNEAILKAGATTAIGLVGAAGILTVVDKISKKK
jgi:hypothetical protein